MTVNHYQSKLTLDYVINLHRYDDNTIKCHILTYIICRIFTEEEFSTLDYPLKLKCYKMLCYGVCPKSMLEMVK